MCPATLFIDLDGVLRLWPSGYSDLEEAHQLPVGSITRAAFASDLLTQVITGRITDEAWRAEVARRLAASHPNSRADAAVTAWSKPVGTVSLDVLNMVMVSREHCSVGLITNATDRLPRDLAALGLTEHLDFVINSSDIGVAKPSPEIFMHALAATNTPPQHAVFIDDTASNVAAANAMGIRSHHFVSAASLRTFMQSVGLPTIAS
ncbi:HAD family hydrolase [Paucibacter sp. M5-1]|uniref:HAD family hydrolase n=1 Tax=Paucibacter sp. M5-1 TaxID=3015998 RepID=UPI0022B866BD|nr:HAD family phosphatase [Paucibacter sp. M5-1]MCZ7884381.1 HAD family phosphatase [Paucibacter sp. M5-1]